MATPAGLPIPPPSQSLRSLSALAALLKLRSQDAQRAWKLAVEKTGGRPMTARLVQRAVQELKLNTPGKGRLPKGQRVERHGLINRCFGELLALLSRRADYQSVLEKVQELHELVEGLFPKLRVHSKK